MRSPTRTRTGGNCFGKAPLAQLADEDAGMVDRALAVLFVLGNEDDAAVVEPLVAHRHERVRKSARTCLFELRRRPAGA